jgi:toxin HigB-1
VIRSFSDKATEALFRDERVRQFEGIARRAKRKPEAVNAACRLDDLTIPPSNRLEKLRGDLKEFHSIRINDQWRVIFRWIDGEPHEVRIVDYHRGNDNDAKRICSNNARRNAERRIFG